MKYYLIGGELNRDYQEWIWATSEDYTEDELSTIAANQVYDKMVLPMLSYCGHVDFKEMISDCMEITEQEYEEKRAEGVEIMIIK